MVFVGRPETISCERCNTSVAVKAKGPVPAFCADCRGKPSRTPQVRPTVVSCERCGSEVAVQSRGPLPRFCRDGCPPQPALARSPAAGASAPAASSSSVAVAVAVQPPTALRPWDRTAESKPSKTSTRPTHKVRSRPDATSPPVSAAERAAALTPRTVTRLDTPHPAAMVQADSIGRTVRVRRFKQAAALAAWLIIIAVIVIIIMVGSRPAPPSF